MAAYRTPAHTVLHLHDQSLRSLVVHCIIIDPGLLVFLRQPGTASLTAVSTCFHTQEWHLGQTLGYQDWVKAITMLN